MKIVQIVAVGDDKAKIVFDDNRQLIVSKKSVYDIGLRKGDEVSEALSERLISESEYHRVKQSALRFLSLRYHSRYELKNKLQKKKFSSEHIDAVLNELTEQNLLNDALFTRKYIAERSQVKKIGPKKIKAELIARGVKAEIIDEELKNLSEDEDELTILINLIRKKREILKKRHIKEKEITNRVIAFLISRGFDFEQIKMAFSQLEEKELHSNGFED